VEIVLDGDALAGHGRNVQNAGNAVGDAIDVVQGKAHARAGLSPPACSLVRPPQKMMVLVPNLEKMFSMALLKPAP